MKYFIKDAGAVKIGLNSRQLMAYYLENKIEEFNLSVSEQNDIWYLFKRLLNHPLVLFKDNSILLSTYSLSHEGSHYKAEPMHLLSMRLRTLKKGNIYYIFSGIVLSGKNIKIEGFLTHESSLTREMRQISIDNFLESA